MKKHIFHLYFISLILFSCGESNEKSDSRILLNFNHHCDNNELSNNALIHTNEAGESYNVQTLKYILTDIKLIPNEKDHDEIILKDIHFVDFNDPSTMFLESEIIENGSYNLSFRFGLDGNTNIANSFTNETFHASMFWPPMIDSMGMEMGGGYHYMKLEGAFNNDSTFYNTHTGPTMGMDHSFLVNFNMFDININNSTENLEYSIEMNINNWYENPNTVNLAPMIMMNMTKQMQLMSNGMTDVFTIEGILD